MPSMPNSDWANASGTSTEFLFSCANSERDTPFSVRSNELLRPSGPVAEIVMTDPVASAP